MVEYFDIQFSNSLCHHHEKCGCVITVTGKHATTSGFSHVSDTGDFNKRLTDCAVQISSSYVIQDDVPVFAQKCAETEYIKLCLQKNLAIKPVGKIPGFKGSWPQSRELPLVDSRVRNSLMRTDIKYFKKWAPGQRIDWYVLSKTAWKTFPTRDVKCVSSRIKREGQEDKIINTWVPSTDPMIGEIIETGKSEDIPSLGAIILRKFSNYHQTLGTYKGRPYVVSAMSSLYDHKYSDSILNMNRPTHKPPEPFKNIVGLIQPAMDLLYHKMKIKTFNKTEGKFTFIDLKDMYLGASNGINLGEYFEIFTDTMEHPIIVSAKGKKCDTFLSDVEAILEFLRTGDKPLIHWNVTAKNENFFSWAKQASDVDWEAWKKKVRLFIIPSSVFILMERMVSRVRVMKERGWVISVGHAHSRGGADKIARMLGIDLMNCLKPIIEEGDAKNFDQTVLEYFVNLYYSTMLIHEDPNTPDYAIKKELVRVLIEDMIARLTRIFGDVFAFVRGQVPSGCWNTSHMDSWIMAMYFMLFGVHQIEQAPEEDKEGMEDHLYNIIMIIVYGDDHLWNKGESKYSAYFGAHQFADFCKTYFRVEIRDIVTGATFVSDVSIGWIIRRGATFLKHQFIINPVKGDGQCQFLPFRESREFMIRAVWGRETKQRDCLDVLMSVIGHAYGTYASNRDAYDRLFFLYESLLEEMNLPVGVVLADVVRRIGYDDMKKLRQVGINSDELLRGFPTWETLVEKNKIDWAYQDTIRDFEETGDFDMF
jgi:hypothetical protein